MKRIKIDDVEKTNFYKMPKKIYEFGLKPVDRELYMLCLENWRLSVKNNWINENGEIFFYASQNKLAQQMKIDKKTVISAFKKLISNHLLEAEKERGEANMYYLANLSEVVEEKFHQSKSSTRLVENLHQYQSEISTRLVEKTDSIKNNTLRINRERINKQELSSSEIEKNQGVENQSIENRSQLNTNTLSTKELNTKLLNTYSLFMEKWNELAKECELSLIKSFTENRKKKLSELLEKFTQEEILETMFKIKNINFLLGRTDKSNWKISFDDFLNEDKFMKIMEGSYYDKNKRTSSKEAGKTIEKNYDLW